MVYENHNQVDYGPLKVNVVEGTTLIQVGMEKQPGVPGACLVLFTEQEHKPVANVRAGADGHFSLKDISPGRYRLAARAEGFCTANIPVEVVKRRRRAVEIVVHFLPSGIDTCSYAEVVPVHRRN